MVSWQGDTDMRNEIQHKVNDGWDVAYCDGSREETAGVLRAGFSVWCGGTDPRNGEGAVPSAEKQTITRAELRRASLALTKKQPGSGCIW